jgi:tRNA modification GTPase
MRERALRVVETAELVVLVQELNDSGPPVSVGRDSDLVVRTKADIATRDLPPAGERCIPVSALTGAGLEELRHALDRLAFGGPVGTSATLALNARHVAAVQEARSALARAAERVNDPSPELLALELREALDAAGRVLGSVTPDELLGRIFSTFCIGK